MEAKRVVVAMSGGVDSSTAALLLKRDGWSPIGAHLRLWSGDPGCAGREKFARNARDAEAVARLLDIPFHTLDFQERFVEEVVRPFVEEYRRGRTPNPCVRCNPRIKLGALLEWARDQGAAAVATGHYARVVHNAGTGRWELRRSADANKDQTYYLHRLSQDQLAAFRTPVGGMTKDAVRRLARENNLPVVEKKESQEICFIPDNDYRGFLEAWREPAGDVGGPILDAAGRVLGRHQGIHRFTIGQRRGIGVSAERPLYVVEIRAEERAVVVGPVSASATRKARGASPCRWFSTASARDACAPARKP